MSGIIVGIDGSGHSQRALEWALKEAALRRVPVTVLTVHQAVRDNLGFVASYPGDVDLTAEAEAAAQAETEKVLAALGSSRPESVTVSGVNGIPARELIKAGEGADMIVVGSRGMGGFSRLMIGSVAGQVAQHAPCPVVIVRPGHRD
jgi:nucleotide-binding universal stress UspA family protein